MVQSFKTLCISALIAIGCFTVSGQVTRASLDAKQMATAGAPKGVMLSGDMLAKIVNDDTDKKATVLTEVNKHAKVPRHATKAKQAKLPAKAAAKVSSLQGYCSYTGSLEEVGWYNFGSDFSTTMKWGKTVQITPRTGFVRGDEVYAFYTYATTSNGLTDAGYYVLDLATGSVKKTVAASIFDTLEQVVVAATYDKASDTAYVVTYNATGSAFLLQQFKPSTGAFTNLTSAPSDWLELGWNPADSSVYMFCEDGVLKKYDSKGKRFSQVNELSFEVDPYTQSMVYSPKDNAFILPIDLYDDSEGEYTAMFLLPVSGSATYLGTLANGPQYAILHTTDEYVNAEGPCAPVLKSWNVTGNSTEGNFVITLPTNYENGSAITGKVYVTISIDNVDKSGSYSGSAGSDITIPVSLEEGTHRFIITPYTLGDDGKINGTPLVFDRVLGNDAPKAPTNVKLTKTNVSWDAVTEGANGGALNPADITYNVYIDGILMNNAPIAATSLDVTMPASGKPAHVAEVYALCDGKISEAGVSAKLYEEGALSLPIFLGPEDGADDMELEVIDMFTPVKDALNNDDLRGWRYDDQSEHTGGFYCLAPKESSKGNTSNEWLFLPAINFPDADAHYRLTMDVWSANHYFTSDETYEIALCQRPNGSRPTVIREATTVYKNANFETSETLFQVPSEGEWYIGIHYISPIGSYRLYARNFKVEVAKSSADSPEAVTSLEAKASERGELSAILTFNMPVNSISGTPLDANTEITAVATSKAGTASVTGKPGQKMTMTVPAVQGTNIISVATSSDKGEGKLAEVTVYCGIYRPATPFVTTHVSDDNSTITFDFELDDYNENDEFTGPDLTDILVYRQVNNEWRVAADLGKQRQWTFTCPEADKQAMYNFGIVSKNEVGFCEEMYTVMAHLGKLYTIPMVETFPVQNETLNPNYEPLTVEHLSYLQMTWGYADPRELDETAANTSGTALCAMWDGESQLVLPRFSTLGHNNVKLDLSLFFGNDAPEAVTVYATNQNIEMEPVATFTASSGKGWEHKLVSLPAMCQNQNWVQLIIRVKIVGYTQTFMMDSYSVKDYPADMMTISSFSGPSRTAVGKTLTYNVEVENAGSSEAALPSYTFAAMSANGVMEHILANEAPASLAPGKKALLTFNVTPKSAHKGTGRVSFKLENQPTEAKALVEQDLEILNAPIPVVTDLSSEINGKDVMLSWTAPVFAEDFESCEPWDMSETIADFKNIDLDNGKEWGIEELNYPGKGVAKGFQVFSAESTSNPLFKAHSGSHYLMCISSSKVASDDWLISPEIVGGSDMSFWMNIFSSDYPETVLVMYSTTGNAPEDFTEMVDNGYVCPDETGWTKYEFTLPANAKYFALNHVADDPEAAFGFMIDDIAYEAAKPTVTLEGYNVYRDNEAIAKDVANTAYTDNNVNLSEPIRYYVMSVGTANGEKMESDRSNVIWVEPSAVDNILAENGKTIIGIDGMIIFKGFASDDTFTLCNVTGAVIATGKIGSELYAVPVASGVYVIKCADTATKVIVK